jgi:hypothetical protein
VGWLLLVSVALLLLLILQPIVMWDRWPYVQIRGRLVDAETGEPLAGLQVFALWDAEERPTEVELERRWEDAEAGRELRGAPASTDHESWILSMGWGGAGPTDAEGRFDLVTQTIWGGNYYPWGLGRDTPDEPPPYHGARALLVEWPDGRRTVVDTTHGTWTVVDPPSTGDIYAVLDIGEVRVRAGR